MDLLDYFCGWRYQKYQPEKFCTFLYMLVHSDVCAVFTDKFICGSINLKLRREKMKKRILSVVLIGLLSVSLCACSKSKPASNNDVGSAKSTEQTTSVELSKETKITNKMPDSEKITTAFDNTINADSFLMFNIMNGYGDVSTFDPMSEVSEVYEFYKNTDSSMVVRTNDYYLYSLSQINLEDDDAIVDFYNNRKTSENAMKVVASFIEGRKVGKISGENFVDYDVKSVKNYSFCSGLRDIDLDSDKYETIKSGMEESEDDFLDFYNRDFKKVLDYSYEYEYGLPYRHFIRAVGMVFDNYSKSKDDFFFVTDFNNEDGVYSFEAYLLDFYRYYAANSDYQLPQETDSDSNDIKIGVKYVLDGNYLTEITAYLLEDYGSKYEDYQSLIFGNVNSINEKDSLACAYYNYRDEYYEPGNYKKAAEVFFNKYEYNNSVKFELGGLDENGIPKIISYIGDTIYEYVYDGYSYKSKDSNSKTVGRNQLGYYTAKEVLDNIVNGTPLPEVPEWKQAYIDYIKDKDDGVYSLIYVDEDDIPELLWDYSESYTLFTYADGKVIENNFVNSGFYYLERKNIFRCGHWVAGLGSDNICKLENGVSSITVSGEWSEYDDNGNTLRDEEGNPLTEYIWNESKVSKEEYDRQLEKSFDMSLAKPIDDSNKYTKKEIIQKIIDWSVSTSTKQASSQNNGQDQDYILPDCDSRYYSQEELEALSAEQLKLARNEIYARHGYIFQTGNTKNYFDSKTCLKEQTLIEFSARKNSGKSTDKGVHFRCFPVHAPPS